MAVIAVTGGLGAPGATTSALALLLSWPLAPGRKVILVECDPDGGAALAGALEGRVEAVYGLRNLAVADRRGLLAQTIWDQLVDISPEGDGERLLLPGLTDPAQAAGLAYTWAPLVEALHALEPLGYDVLLDLGRSGALGAGAVLVRRADAVVATLRTTLRGLSSARPRLAALREDLESAGTGADALGLLLIAEGPYPAADITREFGLPVLGQLPYAVRTARVLSDGGDSTDRRFIRSELMRTARTAADRIQTLVQQRRAKLTPGTEGAAADSAPGGVSDGVPAGLSAAVPVAETWSAGPVAAQAAAAVPAPAAGYGWGAPGDSHPLAYPGTGEQAYGGSWGQPQEAYAPSSGQVYAPAAEPGYGAPVPEQQPYYPVQPPAAQPYGDQSYAGAQQYAAPTYEPSGYVPAPAQAAEEPPAGQLYAAPTGQVFVPPTGPVQVRPGPVAGAQAGQPQLPQPYPPMAGIAPHPAAPEPFPAPAETTETQGEVLRAR